ncbi:MAG: uroporphyrinogen decarboxylase family protein [Clostridia bacterium]
MKQMSVRERFLASMEYGPADRIPNHEIGVWPQTLDRWEKEGLDLQQHHWNWFEGDPAWGMDPREYIPVHYGMIPPFPEEIIEQTDRYLIKRHASGIVTKALLEGSVGNSRTCMDQYLKFPVESPEDFRALKKRFVFNLEERYPENWMDRIREWNARDHVLVLSRNCGTKGFFWRAREWMGTENLCYAWYDMPGLMHEMMEFIADFTIETAAPLLEHVSVDYAFINEDMAMKNGPLLSPAQYREFIFPRFKRVVEYFKSHGVRYVIVDSDGCTEPLIPLLLEAGVDGLWPIERASEHMDPLAIRKKYGKDLRLWGCVDKRELAKGKEEINAHLLSLVPLMEQGGFIPTVDHLVPPDVPLENFIHYMELKQKLLKGDYGI